MNSRIKSEHLAGSNHGYKIYTLIVWRLSLDLAVSMFYPLTWPFVLKIFQFWLGPTQSPTRQIRFYPEQDPWLNWVVQGTRVTEQQYSIRIRFWMRGEWHVLKSHKLSNLMLVVTTMIEPFWGFYKTLYSGELLAEIFEKHLILYILL